MRIFAKAIATAAPARRTKGSSATRITSRIFTRARRARTSRNRRFLCSVHYADSADLPFPDGYAADFTNQHLADEVLGQHPDVSGFRHGWVLAATPDAMGSATLPAMRLAALVERGGRRRGSDYTDGGPNPPLYPTTESVQHPYQTRGLMGAVAWVTRRCVAPGSHSSSARFSRRRRVGDDAMTRRCVLPAPSPPVSD